MPESHVTLTSYADRSDVIRANDALIAAGIESYVDGLKLRVRNVDALRAAEVLDIRYPSLDESGDADEVLPDPNTCPGCGSQEIVRAPRALLFATIALLAIGIGLAFQRSDSAFFAVLAAALLLIMAERQRCAECGESWN